MGDRSLEKVVRDGLRSMPRAQRRKTVEAIQGVIDEQLARDAGIEPEASRCPQCGSVSFRCDGHDAAGRQRYRCKDCGRRFSRTSRSVIGASKLDPAVWKRYAECLVDALTLRKAAARCGVSLKTSWFMRVRLLPAFRVGAGNGCQIDKTYYPESFSGNHTRSQGFAMPRPAKKRGVRAAGKKASGTQAKRGVSKEKICVLTGVSDAGDFFFEVACRGSLTREAASSLLEGKVETGAIVSTAGTNRTQRPSPSSASPCTTRTTRSRTRSTA